MRSPNIEEHIQRIYRKYEPNISEIKKEMTSTSALTKLNYALILEELTSVEDSHQVQA